MIVCGLQQIVAGDDYAWCPGAVVAWQVGLIALDKLRDELGGWLFYERWPVFQHGASTLNDFIGKHFCVLFLGWCRPRRFASSRGLILFRGWDAPSRELLCRGSRPASAVAI